MIRTLFVLTIVVFGVSQAAACSCGAAESIEEDLARTDVLFSGVVLGTRKTTIKEMQDANRVATILAYEILKGDAPERVEVYYWHGDGAECGLRFDEDTVYEVFAGRTGDGRLMTNLCSGTRRASSPPRWTWKEYRKAVGGR